MYLTITFSEDIDATPATNVVPAKIHVRESGSYTGGITLAAGELGTTADGATISFTLSAPHRTTVAGLATPELTIEPGAVRDTSDNLIVGTFDASTAVFVDAFSVSSEETDPTGIAFSSDGTRMFVIGYGGDEINEYALSAAFDASTATHVDATSVSSEEANPTGMAFSNDGAKMFVIGDVGDEINEYALSTAFDASTATHVDATSVSSQESTPQGMAFSSDGAKMFVIGSSSDRIHEYALSTAFDASTAVFVDDTSVRSKERIPTGMAFSSDGAKMFVIGNHGKEINEYTLSTPFDASTATHVDATSVSSQEADPQGMAFSSDGAKMFVVGVTGDNVNEYDLHSVYSITVTGVSTVLPAGAFATTWDVTASPYTISIPLEVHAGETLTISWGDSSADTTVTADGTQSHTYSTSGKYQVSMTGGGLARINLGASDSTAAKLASIDQWGDIEWATMNSAFKGASNMEYNANDTPDLIDVTNMASMFNQASAFDGDISGWDVSAVTNMASMFTQASAFNQDLPNWNVAAVTDMYGMFDAASAFDGDISGWDVSAVTDMEEMFSDATAFNGDISGWNVSNVIGMDSTLNGADSFIQNLGPWYVTLNNTSIDLAGSGITIGTISAQNSQLDGQNPAYGIGTGSDSDKFEISGDNLNVKAGENYAAKTAYTVNITSTGFWGTNNHLLVGVTVTGTSPPPVGAFATTWDATASPHTISIPLEVHSGDPLTISWGDSSADTTVTADGTQSHTYSTSGEYQVSMTGGLSRINLHDSDSTASKLVSINQWGDIEWATMDGAFRGASSMEYAATDAPDLSGVTSMQYMFFDAAAFDGDLSGWDVSNVENMGATFYGTSFNGDLSEWDVSSVTTMEFMFYNAGSFNQDLSSWNTASVTDTSFMFGNAGSFNRDLPSWNTASVTDMTYMFDGAAAFDGDISGWDVSSVTDTSFMFNQASAFDGDISEWDVSSVVNMEYMFSNAATFNSDISSWNVSGVTNMQDMFSSATTFNRDISSWNVSGVINMQAMFSLAGSFDQNLGKWYVVPDSTEIARTDVPGVVGSISVQTSWLDRHDPEYYIGTGGDSARFDIVNGNELSMTSVEAKFDYTVIVTANGTDVFEDGNNWRVLDVMVTGIANQPPIVTGITGDATISEGTSGTLTGTATDDDGTVSSYSWSVDNTSAVTITTGNAATLQYTASQVDSDTAVTFTLTVTDDDNATGSLTHDVTIINLAANQPPIVTGITGDATISEGTSGTLTGTATDDDGMISSYSWSVDNTSAVTITTGNAATLQYTASQVSSDTTVTFTLTVTDDDNATGSLTHDVTVTDVPPPPGTFEAAITPPASPTNQDPTFDVTFGSAIPAEEFTAGDVATSPAGLDVSVSSSGTSFSFTINGAPDGRITAQIPAGAVSDGGGDSNAASNRAVATVDKTDPRITSARVSGSDTITVSFSEGVQGTTGTSDWSLDGAPGVAVNSATVLPGGSVALGLSGDLPGDRPELTLGYTGTGVEDLAGNPLGTATIAVSYPSSDRSRGQSAPPVFDIGSVIKSYPQSVPEWVIQAAAAHDPGTPIPPISVNGTFAFPLEINSMGYLLDGPVNTLVPHAIPAGQPVTIMVTVYDPTPIAYFAMYLNLQGDQISHLQSDTQVIWDSGEVRVTDPNGLMQDASVTLSEDPDDPAKKTATVTVTLSDGMGETNMVIRTWNAAGQLAEVKIFDALDVRTQEPEPVAVDPEPGMEPNSVDPEPVTVPVTAPGVADSQSAAGPDADRDTLAIRMWSGFEPESISDAQLLASLGLDYPGVDIPSWVMTELGPLVAKGDITAGEFKTALEYVLEHVLEHS